jgi:iron complex outermembrane receptor protein
MTRLNRKTRQFRMTAVAFATFCLAAGIAPAASAQDTPAAAPEKVQQIVVTGTSIRGVGAVGSPSLAMNRDAIAASGAKDSSEIARLLPQVINLGADESRLGGAQDAAANTTRTSGINLRGIGNEATLLLVNGRRVASSGVIKALADPNQIPAAAIQRMEVVLDGASAIYGSDAVAGVVNIITRGNVDAVETMLRYGGADGMNQTIFSQTLGKTWDAGSVFVAYEHNDRGSLAANARPFFSNDLRPYGGADQRSTQAAPGNVLIGRNIYAIPAGQDGTGLNPSQLVLGGGNRYDAGTVGDFLPSQKRDTLYANAYHKFSDRLEVFYEGLYSQRDYSQRTAPLGANLNVPAASPYYVRPAGAPAGASETVAYRFLFDDRDLSIGGRENNSQNAIGLTLDVDNGWEINSSYSYGKNDAWVHRNGLINTGNVGRAIAAGTINPFSALAGANPGFADFAAHRDQTATNKDSTLMFKVDGPIARLSAGNARLAVGSELRHVSFVQGLWQNVTTPTTTARHSELRNSRSVKSLYSELYVPLVGGNTATPFVKRLELSVAGRYERYSDFGSTTNPKVGLTWAVNDKVSFNTTYGTSFRAPSLVDNLGSLTNLSLTNIFVQDISDPTAPGGVRHGIYVNGGNPELKPEKARTWSFGADIKPARGMTIAASYYKIDYTDRIDTIQANSALADEALYAQYIVRNPSAALVNSYFASPNLQSPPENPANIGVVIDGRRSNLGSLRQHGVDLDSRYVVKTGSGDWMVGLNVAKILKLERSSAPGLPFTDVLDTFGNPVSLRMRASAGWKLGAVAANVFANYIGGYTNTAIVPNTEAPSMTTFDATLTYAVDKGVGYGFGGAVLALSAQNLFDRAPPVVLNGTSSWDSQNASAVGRFVSLSLTKRW